MHLAAGSYDRYEPNNLDEGRKNPEKFRHKATLEEASNLIGENQFAVSHIDYNKKSESIFKDFKKIILHRDPSEAGKSWNRWKQQSGRQMKDRNTIPNSSALSWSGKENTFTLPFDDMVNKNVQKIDELQLFLFAQLKYNSTAIIEKSLAQDSLTKSSSRC